MAQLEKTMRSSHTLNTFKSHQTSPTFEQLIRAEETKLSPRDSSLGLGINSDQEEYLKPNKGRKSVLARVKERAVKLRHSLSGRRKFPTEIDREVDDCDSRTHRWELLEYMNHNDHIRNDNMDDELDEDPEYFGAPMYESEAAPESVKENARQHPRAVPVVSESHRTPASHRNKSASKSTDFNVAITEAENVQSRSQESDIGSQTENNGVSVKKYFMNKLEPGDDERALSQVITEAITPRRWTSSTEESRGVVQKVKGAVASFLWHHEPTNSYKDKVVEASAAAPGSTNVHTCSRQIPVSYNVYKGIEKESHGRILQAN